MELRPPDGPAAPGVCTAMSTQSEPRFSTFDILFLSGCAAVTIGWVGCLTWVVGGAIRLW